MLDYMNEDDYDRDDEKFELLIALRSLRNKLAGNDLQRLEAAIEIVERSM